MSLKGKRMVSAIGNKNHLIHGFSDLETNSSFSS